MVAAATASGEGKTEKFQLNLSHPEDLTLQVTRYNESREATRQQKIREREMQEVRMAGCGFYGLLGRVEPLS